jgi:hypothetical protein
MVRVGCPTATAATCAAVRRRVRMLQRMMWSGFVKIVRSGGSTFPFHSTSRCRRRRLVLFTTRGKTTLQNGRSSHTIRSARSASSGRTIVYCHSVVHAGCDVNCSTSVTNSGRGVHCGPWKSASISTCCPPVIAAIRRARVVFPAPETPATTTRCGRIGSGSAKVCTVRV